MNCPKCDRDISDSYEPDDPSVGIVGGWSCEDCDEGFAEWEYGDEPPDDAVSFSSIRYSCPEARIPTPDEPISTTGTEVRG